MKMNSKRLSERTHQIEKTDSRGHVYLVLIGAMLVASCTEKSPEPTQISQQPPAATQVANADITHQSRLSTRARIPYTDIAALIEEEVPPEYQGTGKQQTCKRVLGIKICGTARWQYTVQRSGNIVVSGQDDETILKLPMRFFGNAGLNGGLAKALQLDDLDFDGAMDVQLRLKLDLADNWCPIIKTQVDYTWTKTPKVEWTAGIDFNLKSHLDKAIAKQLIGLQDLATNAVDCNEFRENIQAQWRQYSIPIDLPNDNRLHLNIKPNQFSFSGIKTEQDSLGIAFALDAETSVQDTAIETKPLPLPSLERVPYQTGDTQFNLLVKASYDQLKTLAAPQVIGKTFSEDSPAGLVSVTVNALDFSGNPTGITVNLGFNATLPGSRKDTPGSIYLTATPVIDAFTQTIKLDNIELSNVIDSALWNTLATVFNKKIISELENTAVFEIGPKLSDLADTLEVQLADPSRTSGLKISEPEVNVYLVSLIPEKDNLSALVRVETQLDIEVPIKTLYQQKASR